MKIDDYVDRFFDWGADHGIHDTDNLMPQIMKLGEEYGELCAGVARDDQERILDAMGDMLVVMVQVGAVAGVRYGDYEHSGQYLQRAMECAWDQIKRRTGKMRGGVFVKDGEL